MRPRAFIAIPLPPPATWQRLRDPSELPDGYIIGSLELGRVGLPGSNRSSLLWRLVRWTRAALSRISHGAARARPSCAHRAAPSRVSPPAPPALPPRDRLGWPSPATSEIDQLEALLGALAKLNGDQRDQVLAYARAVKQTEPPLPPGYSR
jgi:hypothetical protein